MEQKRTSSGRYIYAAILFLVGAASALQYAAPGVGAGCLCLAWTTLYVPAPARLNMTVAQIHADIAARGRRSPLVGRLLSYTGIILIIAGAVSNYRHWA